MAPIAVGLDYGDVALSTVIATGLTWQSLGHQN